MTDDTDLPPWEPIADWLLRITDAADADGRDAVEQTAKAIAYDVATYDGDDPPLRRDDTANGDGGGEIDEILEDVREQ